MTTMNLIQTVCSNRIALRAGKQEVHSAEIGFDPSVQRSATELIPKPKLLRCKNIVNITIFNVRTLNTLNQLPELLTYAAEHSKDTVCTEHRYYHSN